MLGLLQCSVPPILKAEILHCLAAFGKSPEIAASLWQSLEYTQVCVCDKKQYLKRTTKNLQYILIFEWNLLIIVPAV